MSSTYIPDRALFIYAHPDDIEFGVAGTAALWAKHGCSVKYVVITDGNIGSHEEGMTTQKLAEIRRSEQTAAAEHVGATVKFLGYDDGILQPTLDLRRDLVREIREHRPNVVVCGDPRTFFPRDSYINHPDHRAAATAAVEACFPAPNSPLIFPELVHEGFMPHDINYVYISHPSDGANCYVDISETIDLKIEALRLHKSQLGDWDPTARMKEWAQEIGRKVGFKHAERYRRITLKELLPSEDE